MKNMTKVYALALIGLFTGGELAFAAAPAGGPPASAPATSPASQPGRGARGGARGGGGRGGAPLSDADKAEIAKLDTFPEWKPGAGNGNYFIGPNYANA